MSLYLLDTNIVSDLVRNPRGVASRRLGLAHGVAITSILVEAELRYGAEKRGSLRLMSEIEGVLARIDVVPFEKPAEQVYGRLRADLERRGQRIGDIDMLIAAHTLALDATLVTANTCEFERVDGLRVENWLA